MTIDAEDFRREVDELDTGLPVLPDLDLVHTAVRRRRRCRLAATGTGALALALGAAVLLPSGGGGDVVRAEDRSVASRPDTSLVAPAAPVELAGPWFGPQVGDAVAEVFPELSKSGQLRGDHYLPLDDDSTYRMAVDSPVSWDTFFSWVSFFDSPVDGVRLDVASTRESPDAPDVTGPDGVCRDGLYPVRQSCRVLTVGGRVVVQSDGIRFAQGGVWHRKVEVFGPDGVRGMDSQVVVSVFGTARTATAADAELPSLAALQRLALDPDLVLPEPVAFPDAFPE